VSSTAPVYDTIGQQYTAHRQPDPRWAALITQQLGDARRVVNVGAGTGSYEPPSSPTRPSSLSAASLLAIEPSSVMIAQRPPGAAPVVRASATALPMVTGSADAAMAILTVHHWGDWATGLAELRRVANRRVILTIDFEHHAEFWLLRDYLPHVAAAELGLSPTVAQISASLPITDILELPLPADMEDGVLGAHWCRPEAYLDPVVRSNCSPLALADPSATAQGIAKLAEDLTTGAWHRRYADLLELDSYDAGYRLLVSEGD
jgi:ubiquinone/menaquinone biosynthesis C-methylase UbiE